MWHQLAVDRLEEQDIEKLEASSLILNQEWICIDFSSEVFKSKIGALNLTNQANSSARLDHQKKRE